MAQYKKTDNPVSLGLCKSGRRLRFEACESRLALDGASFESIPLFEQAGLTEFTTGGITYSLEQPTSVAFSSSQTVDVYSFSDGRGTLQPILVIGNGAVNDISFSDAITRFLLDGTARDFSDSLGEYDQGAAELWRLTPFEPIQRLPHATDQSLEIAAEVSDSGETIAIASLLENIPDGVSHQAPLTPLEQGPTQQPLKSSPPSVLASYASIAEESVTNRIQRIPSGHARAWAFEVASLDIPSPTTSLHTVSPKEAAPTPQKHPVAPAKTDRDVLPATTSSAGFTSMLFNESNSALLLSVGSLDQAETNANSSSQDAAFASLGAQDECEFSWRRQIDHRHAWAASLLALLVVDRVRFSSMLSGAEPASESAARKPTHGREKPDAI